MNPIQEKAYYAAIKADNEFQSAVEKQFGKKDAGDMRYRTELFNAETKKAFKKFRDALETQMRAGRTKTRKNASPTQDAVERIEAQEKKISDRKRLASEMGKEANRGIKKIRDEMRKAKKDFESFTGLKAENAVKVRYETPKAAVVIGRLVEVVYEAERLDVQGFVGEDDVALYRHEFSAKNPPVLAASPDGKTLLIIGGGAYFDAKKGGIIG